MQRILALALLTLVCFTARALPTGAAEPQSLLQRIAGWQYPGSAIQASEMSDAATIDEKGDRTVPSIVCKTVMTTEEPIEKVVEYYRTKLATSPKADGGKPKPSKAPGRSVVFSDDSEGRPLALHTVLINTSDTSTTLIISRGKDEMKTFIVWKQYQRLSR
jgi:hypothetical protein